MYSEERNLLIDCLRGFSILIVAASHGLLTALPTRYLDTLFKGYYGVAIFFTISGFLITRNTLKRYDRPSRIDFGQFYAMRVARIIPCLLLFLTVMVFLFWCRVASFIPANHQLVWSGIYNALMFQYNSFYFVGNVPGMQAWSPLWSLSIEEVFYFAFPIACFLTRRTSVLVVLMLALIAYGPLQRMDYAGLFSFWGTADLLSLGCLAAIFERYVSNYDVTKQAPFICVTGAAIAVATIAETSPAADYWAPSLIGFGAALFLLGAAHLPLIKPWHVVTPITWLLSKYGQVSYEIYLFHVAWILFYKVALKWCFGPSWEAQMQSAVLGLCTTAVIIGITLAFGTLISRLFTEPWNKKIRSIYAREALEIEQRNIKIVVPAMPTTVTP
jgi:peptidoglycan/LPS O-acetylase OafA/YrhL